MTSVKVRVAGFVASSTKVRLVGMSALLGPRVTNPSCRQVSANRGIGHLEEVRGSSSLLEFRRTEIRLDDFIDCAAGIRPRQAPDEGRGGVDVEGFGDRFGSHSPICTYQRSVFFTVRIGINSLDLLLEPKAREPPSPQARCLSMLKP